MSNAYWVTGDTLTTLRTMPDHSIDVVITSPPFLALRSYLPADDPAKALEIGQEGTPGAFLDVLLDITEELRRVLAPHGSICVELGDTYSGSGGAGGDYSDDGLRAGQQPFDGSARRTRPVKASPDTRTDHAPVTMGDGTVPVTGGRGWPDAKSACLIPELYRVALAYGRNPLTGRECSRWRIRNTVRWVRPNPPVGALGDKFRPATSDMVIATMARDRYFDLDAVRTQPLGEQSPNKVQPSTGSRNDDGQGFYNGGNPAGAPPLDWWEIPTHPYKGSHYATFPPALVERPVKAMCPQRVCTICGQPSRRILGDTQEYAEFKASNKWESGGLTTSNLNRPNIDFSMQRVETLGWTDCGHDSWRNGRVLDPFGGSGTTLAVATGHGRDAIGIDLDARNADLARERIGMFLTQVTTDDLTAILTPQEVTTP